MTAPAQFPLLRLHAQPCDLGVDAFGDECRAVLARVEELEAELTVALEDLADARCRQWSPPSGPRVAGVPPWQAGRRLTSATSNWDFPYGIYTYTEYSA